MQRYCFRLQIQPDKVAEYVAHHQRVWPEMLTALRDAGWHNYSIFVDADGLCVGYVESEDLVAAQRAMSDTDVNARWQATTAPFFEGIDVNPDEGFTLIPMAFNLEQQLAALDQGEES